jgi:hypothetical protein
MTSTRSIMIAWVIVVTVAPNASAQRGTASSVTRPQNAVEILKELNFSRERPRSPETSRAATEPLSVAARKVRDALVLIGSPDDKLRRLATGFVISKSNRLVATNAHVADLNAELVPLYVVPNGKTTAFTVDKVWYHPALVRIDSDGVPRRSTDPGVGTVYSFCPDVAVLQLKEDKNNVLPAEVILASPGEITDLWALQAWMAGYPSTNTTFPQSTNSSSFSATIHGGMIEHFGNFAGGVDPDNSNNQLVEYTMETSGGFSGSPVFLHNGHVVAIDNAHRTEQTREMTTTVASGIRIDSLWELLAFNKMENQVNPPVMVDSAQMQRNTDPKRPVDQKPIQAINDLGTLNGRSFDDQGRILSKDIEAAPKMAILYYKRGLWYLNNLRSAGGKMTKDERIAQLTHAAEDFKMTISLDPNNVRAMLYSCYVSAQTIGEKARAQAAKQTDYTAVIQQTDYTAVIQHIDNILAIQTLTLGQQAWAWQIRAFCHWSSPDAKDDLDKAIDLVPQWDVSYLLRSQYWTALNNTTGAKSDTDQVNKIAQQKKAARAAVTNAQQHPRNTVTAQSALTAAQNASKTINDQESTCLHCLAHIHAEMGNFDEARKQAAAALLYCPDEKRQSEIREDLDSYSRKQPTKHSP